MNKTILKKYLPYVGTILLFIAIAVGYFTPDIFEGKTLFQGDTQQGIAVGREGANYLAETGERTRWTGSLFSGMPTYQISPSYDSTGLLTVIHDLFFGFLPKPASYLFLMLLCFFIFMKCIRVRNDLAILGAIMWTFSSYFLVLIEAGHLWKFITLAFIPPTIGGLMMVYQGERLKGGAIFGLFVGLQILSNHVQMTYYFLFVMAAIAVAFLVDAIKEKRISHFLKSTGVLIIAGVLGVGMNASNLFHTYEYSKETIRGKTELTAKASESATEGGLEKDYITQWSYGIDETATFLIPNAKGGATGQLANNKEALENAHPDYREVVSYMNSYWGDQPFTSGPVYAGIFVLFLALLGFFYFRNALSWSLCATLIVTVMLSWGKNFMPLTDLFIDYFPMYDKFRTVSSILVVAEFILPVMAVWMLVEWFKAPSKVFARKKELITALSLTGGVTLLMIIFPSLFNSFAGVNDDAYIGMITQQVPQLADHVQYIKNEMYTVRQAIFTADAWRSMAFLAVGVIILFAHYKGWLKEKTAIWAIIALTFIDLVGVDKRYLNSDSFVPKSRISNPFPKNRADEMILQDTTHYRVFNVSVDPFNDSRTSYHHKSIGGYHAAKLRRYQELIDHQLRNNNMAVINMLNTKYFIVPDQQQQGGGVTAQLNTNACGNAWFVNELQWVDNADQELDALTNFNPRKSAVIDRRFEELVKNKTIAATDTNAVVRLTNYSPNHLSYHSESTTNGFVVFSEVYYSKGWKLLVDGNEQPLVRVNYVLRGAEIPAGEHQIEMIFKPKSITITETLAFISFIVILLALALALFLTLRKKKV